MNDKEWRKEVRRLEASILGVVHFRQCENCEEARELEALAAGSLQSRLHDDMRAIERRLGPYPDVGRMIDDLSRRVADFEGQKNLHEKDCPECKRKTLMKRKPERIVSTLEEGTFELKPPRFYCYSCGRTFVESTKTELVEEGDGEKV